MSSDDVLLPFALRDETLVDITSPSVLNGLSCACVCPNCRRPVLAKRGPIKAPHFAHIEHNGDCIYPVFRTLYKRAKECIEREGRIWLPPIMLGSQVPGRFYSVEDTELTEGVGKMLPKFILEIAGRKVWIDLRLKRNAFTKRIKLFRSEQTSTVGIHLLQENSDLSQDSLFAKILGPGYHKSWLYHYKAVKFDRLAA